MICGRGDKSVNWRVTDDERDIGKFPKRKLLSSNIKVGPKGSYWKAGSPTVSGLKSASDSSLRNGLSAVGVDEIRLSGTQTERIPAPLAARTPAMESSKTRTELGSTGGGLKRDAQTRKGCGSGLPRLISGSSGVMIMWLNSEKKSRWKRVFRSKLTRRVLVAMAIGTRCRWRWRTSRSAPGIRGMWRENCLAHSIVVRWTNCSALRGRDSSEMMKEALWAAGTPVTFSNAKKAITKIRFRSYGERQSTTYVEVQR